MKMPWDIPTSDRALYEPICAKSPEDRTPLEALAKKYIDLCAQAIGDCDSLDNCVRIASLKTGADRDSWLEDAGYFAAIIERIAALEARRKPKCPDCNSVGMAHCSDPENCGGVYWPDHRYRALETQVKTLGEALDGLLARHCDGSDERHWAEWDAIDRIIAARLAAAQKEHAALNDQP